MRRRSLLVASVLSAVVVAYLHAPVAAGGTLTYPTDCPVSVQSCVDAAGDGWVVLVASNATIDEYVDIHKSLSLKAADGFHPTLRAVSVEGAANPVSVDIEHLRFTVGVDVSLDVGSGHLVSVRHITVDQSTDEGAGVYLSTSVNATLQIEHSRIHTESHQSPGISLRASGAASAFLSAIGNRIDQRHYTDGGSGIDFEVDGTAHARAVLYDNVIWDVAGGRSGGSSGIYVDLGDTPIADVDIVGNTIEHVATRGLGVRNDAVAPGHLSLDLFDNIFSHEQEGAIGFDPAGPMTFRAGYNDHFGNKEPDFLDGKSHGTHNLKVDPRFVDRAMRNLRLRSSSPLIDKGQICTPGGLGGPDAAGRDRLAGKSVDIGAYETNSTDTGGAVYAGGTGPGAQLLIGTPGADVICGYGGSDDVEGGGGADYLDGGSGPDFVGGGGGPDRMYGGPGADTLCANDGHANDRVDGGPGNDGYAADVGDTRISLEHAAVCAA